MKLTSEKMQEYFEKIKKNPKIIVIIGIIGILLIFLSSVLPKSTSVSASSTNSKTVASEYSKELENELEEQIKTAVGGDVKVMITLESGVEYIYASQVKNDESNVSDSDNSSGSKSQSDKKSENEYILYKDENGSEVPLVVTEVMPNVKGVVVCCKNGDTTAIEATVTSLVTTALNISSSRVCVVGNS